MASKRIYETDAVKAFAAQMSSASKRKYLLAKSVLAERGWIGYPEDEKFSQYDNLFAIRIVTRGNERFFYCYENPDLVLILHAFTKKTMKTPNAELNYALKIKKELLGG